MSIRPGFKKLLKSGPPPNTIDLKLVTLSEDFGGDSQAPEIPTLAFDPSSPVDGEKWLRADKSPPELRLYTQGQTWAVAFVAAAADAAEPLIPDIGLAPPLIPEGQTHAPLVPDIGLAPPLIPQGA